MLKASTKSLNLTRQGSVTAETYAALSVDVNGLVSFQKSTEILLLEFAFT